MRVNLPLILHHADHMAATIEYDLWKNSTGNVTPIKTMNTSISKGNRTAKLESIANNPANTTTSNLSSMFDDIFGDK
jgi:L-ascorbate metabolism protein UlaG (beta-lactamase superfamily)